MTLKRTVLGILLFYVALLLLNGSALYDASTRFEYGAKRDFWMKVLKPLDTISRASGASWLRSSVQGSAGKWLNSGEGEG